MIQSINAPINKSALARFGVWGGCEGPRTFSKEATDCISAALPSKDAHAGCCPPATPFLPPPFAARPLLRLHETATATAPFRALIFVPTLIPALSCSWQCGRSAAAMAPFKLPAASTSSGTRSPTCIDGNPQQHQGRIYCGTFIAPSALPHLPHTSAGRPPLSNTDSSRGPHCRRRSGGHLQPAPILCRSRCPRLYPLHCPQPRALVMPFLAICGARAARVARAISMSVDVNIPGCILLSINASNHYCIYQ